MLIEEYIDKIIKDGLEKNHWFMTKQTMSDYYFPFFISTIIESYPICHDENQNFQKYYTKCFAENEETKKLYPKQGESENTYRNAIITEFLGLVANDERQYAKAMVTDAYKTLHQYIKERSDIEKYRMMVDHQIEKICLNVIPSSKYNDVKSVTIFPAIVLYKILLLLKEKYGNSKLNYDEFSLFVIRTQNYDDIPNVLDLIEQYRKHKFDAVYNNKIKAILDHQSSKNVRFNALFGSLQHIEYLPWESYEIKNDTKSYTYVQKIVDIFESSEYRFNTDKNKLTLFMRSNYFFKGKIDDTTINVAPSQEEFRKMVEKEDDFLNKLKELAKIYGEDGTTVITTTVRLNSVQRAFRDKLIETYGQKCIMCDATNADLLVASHIKEASSCNIYEKADYQNGLLLCAIHDKLFDRHLITFNFFDGKIQISPELTEREKEIFMLDENFQLPEELLTPERTEYLMWHNTEYYKRNDKDVLHE